MAELYYKVNSEYLGSISEEDLQFLIDNLVEEDSEDDDYYINQTTLDMLKERGLNAEVAKLIEDAMKGSGEVEIQYKKEE